MNIRTSILYISSSLIFLTNINTGSHHTHGDDMQTPQRDTLQKGQARHTVAQTPGQIVSQKQPGVFNYARLKSVLGMPFVNAAKLQCVGKDEDELEVNWNKIFNPLTPHNEKTKLQAIRKIPTLLLHYTGERDTLYLVLSDEVSRLNTETKQVPLTRIEESSKEHFEQRFPRSTVTTSAKRGGDQLGCIAEVTLADTQVLKYYVKTHSEGLKSGHSSAAKLVNPAELLVYKVLENIEIGPQSHFFGRDGENLYIATLDAGIQANIEGTFTQVPFYEYSYFKETEKPAVQEHLWGTLSQIPTDSQLSDTQHQKIEEKVASSLSAQNFISEVTKLDLVARIMELGDFQTNPGNYGFVFSESPPPQAMAIDFRIVQTYRIPSSRDSMINDLLRGNGQFNYASTGAAMYYALCQRPVELRMQTSSTVFKSIFSEFIQKVESAVEHVLQVLNEHNLPDIDRRETEAKLLQYSETIKQNFLLFQNYLIKQ